ncbi:MAG: tryptophan synthase subunit alpha [Gammaproteobacteria bacterium]
MSRIQQCFTRLKAQGRKALIPYITAGDPDLGNSLGIMHALVKNGADVIELGFPFSDPSSDGPVIQRAIERALARGTTLRRTLDLVAKFRETNNDTPIVLMGYLNPVEFMGYQKFVDAAVKAGIDGVILVDMPPEESHELHVILRKAGLDTIYLVAPTTSDARMEAICKQSSGYVYYVSLKGVTGAAHLDVDSVASNLARLRKHTDLPLGVGFGIGDGQSAARVAAVADAVVVGSALIRRIAELQEGGVYTPEQLTAQTSIIADMRAAMDATR